MFVETFLYFSLLEVIGNSTFYVNYYLCYLLCGAIMMITAGVLRHLISTNIIIIMLTGRRTKSPIWWIEIQEGATSVLQSFWDVTVNQALPYSSASAGNIFIHLSSAAAQLHHMWIFTFFSFTCKKYFIYKIKIIKTISSFIRAI